MTKKNNNIEQFQPETFEKSINDLAKKVDVFFDTQLEPVKKPAKELLKTGEAVKQMTIKIASAFAAFGSFGAGISKTLIDTVTGSWDWVADNVNSLFGWTKEKVKNVTKNITGNSETKEVVATGENLAQAFLASYKKYISGNVIRRKLYSGTQSKLTACYNVAENTVSDIFPGADLKTEKNMYKTFNLQSIFGRNIPSKPGEQYKSKNMLGKLINEGQLKPGDAVWLQKSVDYTDVSSQRPASGNHWIVYLGPNKNGEPQFGDQGWYSDHKAVHTLAQVQSESWIADRYVTRVFRPKVAMTPAITV